MTPRISRYENIRATAPRSAPVLIMAAIWLLACMSPAAHAAAALANVTSIRVADHSRYQRVVIDTSHAVTYQFTNGESNLRLELAGALANPRTLTWLDMGKLKGAVVEQVSDDLVTITFDIDGAARPRISKYAPDSYGGHRIVIDLWPVSAPAPKPALQDSSKIIPGTDPITNNAALAAQLQDTASRSQITPLSSGTSWPDLGDTDGEDGESGDLMSVPGLQDAQQWPDLAREAQKLIVENQSSPLLPEAPGNTEPADLPLKPSIIAAASPQDHIAAARQSLAQGNPGEACKALQLKFPKGTWNIEAMTLQGTCLVELGKLSAANTLYAEVLSFEPQNIEARIGLADAQADTGDYVAARDNYVRVLEIMPTGNEVGAIKQKLQQVEDHIKHAVN